jgi:hypothetical protein
VTLSVGARSSRLRGPVIDKIDKRYTRTGGEICRLMPRHRLAAHPVLG